MRTPEPTITINGVALSEAQSTVVRVAVTSMRHQLTDLGYRRALGPIAEAYDARLTEVEDIMIPERGA